jgi:hypothetical protein
MDDAGAARADLGVGRVGVFEMTGMTTKPPQPHWRSYDDRRSLLPCATLVSVLIIGAAEAQPRYFHPMGAASESCSGWTTARQANNTRSWVNEQWVLGFLSGVGYVGHQNGLDPLNGMDEQGVVAWIDNYCREHSLDALVVAAVAFRQAHPY